MTEKRELHPELYALRDECITIAGIVCCMETMEHLEPFLGQALGRSTVRFGAVHRLVGLHPARSVDDFDAALPRKKLLGALLGEETKGRGKRGADANTTALNHLHTQLEAERAAHRETAAKLRKAELVSDFDRVLTAFEPVKSSVAAMDMLMAQLLAVDAIERGVPVVQVHTHGPDLPLVGAGRGYDQKVQPARTRLSIQQEKAPHGLDIIGRPRPAPVVRIVDDKAAALPGRAPGGGLRAGVLRMLVALATFYPGSMTRPQVGRVAKMKHTGGTFTAYWGQLRREGLIEEHRLGMFRATEAGLKRLGSQLPKVPKDMAGRIAFWNSRLRKGEREMLDVVVKHVGVMRHDLAGMVGMAASGGTFTAYLGTLVTNRLVQKTASGAYVVHPWLESGKDVP